MLHHLKHEVEILGWRLLLMFIVFRSTIYVWVLGFSILRSSLPSQIFPEPRVESRGILEVLFADLPLLNNEKHIFIISKWRTDMGV